MDRLQEIKALHALEKVGVQGMKSSNHVSHSDVEWLIGQVEKTEILKKGLDSCLRTAEGMTEDYHSAEKLLRKYEEALEEVKSLTTNPREYQPSYHTLHHIARIALEVEVSGNEKN